MSKRKQKLANDQEIFVNQFTPRTKKQSEFIDLINSREIVVAIGIAGSGKTITALASALNLLGNYYENIILVKSVITIPGEEVGFIPGGYEEKMVPHLMSYTWNLDKILGDGSSDKLIRKGIIKILPLAYVRGVSIDKSIVIIDEAQNLDTHTFKTIVTRIGDRSKYIFLGDIEQVDRRNKQESCLYKVMDIFSDNETIGTIKFEDSDCVRNPIIPKVLQKLRENNI